MDHPVRTLLYELFAAPPLWLLPQTLQLGVSTAGFLTAYVLGAGVSERARIQILPKESVHLPLSQVQQLPSVQSIARADSVFTPLQNRLNTQCRNGRLPIPFACALNALNWI